MNPFSSKIKDMKLAPMREVRKTLQIRWYRCPVDKKILRDLMMPSDARGLCMSLGHLSLWLATGGVTFYLFSQQMWVGCLVALFFHGTVGSFFTAPHHELCHRTVFKTKWLNESFLRIFSLLGWNNYEIYAFVM